MPGKAKPAILYSRSFGSSKRPMNQLQVYTFNVSALFSYSSFVRFAISSGILPVITSCDSSSLVAEQ